MLHMHISIISDIIYKYIYIKANEFSTQNTYPLKSIISLLKGFMTSLPCANLPNSFKA